MFAIFVRDVRCKFIRAPHHRGQHSLAAPSVRTVAIVAAGERASERTWSLKIERKVGKLVWLCWPMDNSNLNSNTNNNNNTIRSMAIIINREMQSKLWEPGERVNSRLELCVRFEIGEKLQTDSNPTPKQQQQQQQQKQQHEQEQLTLSIEAWAHYCWRYHWLELLLLFSLLLLRAESVCLYNIQPDIQPACQPDR